MGRVTCRECGEAVELDDEVVELATGYFVHTECYKGNFE